MEKRRRDSKRIRRAEKNLPARSAAAGCDSEEDQAGRRKERRRVSRLRSPFERLRNENPARATTCLAWEQLGEGAMVETGEAKFPTDGREQVRPIHAADTRSPKRPAISKSKKERPAGKGRVHKGRTRN
jgi:hypothetical protein